MSIKKTKKVTKSYGIEKILSVGVLSLSAALIFTSVFLLIKSKVISTEVNNDIETTQESLQGNPKGTEIYVDEKFGYSMTYPRILEPRTIESDDYQSLIIFFVPKDLSGNDFAISVSERKLEEERNLINQQISKETTIKQTEETPAQKGGLAGTKIIFEPEDKESFESKAFVVINNGKYTYTLSSSPNFIDEVLNNFTILN